MGGRPLKQAFEHGIVAEKQYVNRSAAFYGYKQYAEHRRCRVYQKSPAQTVVNYRDGGDKTRHGQKADAGGREKGGDVYEHNGHRR